MGGCWERPELLGVCMQRQGRSRWRLSCGRCCACLPRTIPVEAAKVLVSIHCKQGMRWGWEGVWGSLGRAGRERRAAGALTWGRVRKQLWGQAQNPHSRLPLAEPRLSLPFRFPLPTPMFLHGDGAEHGAAQVRHAPALRQPGEQAVFWLLNLALFMFSPLHSPVSVSIAVKVGGRDHQHLLQLAGGGGGAADGEQQRCQAHDLSLHHESGRARHGGVAARSDCRGNGYQHGPNGRAKCKSAAIQPNGWVEEN